MSVCPFLQQLHMQVLVKISQSTRIAVLRTRIVAVRHRGGIGRRTHRVNGRIEGNVLLTLDIAQVGLQANIGNHVLGEAVLGREESLLVIRLHERQRREQEISVSSTMSPVDVEHIATVESIVNESVSTQRRILSINENRTVGTEFIDQDFLPSGKCVGSSLHLPDVGGEAEVIGECGGEVAQFGTCCIGVVIRSQGFSHIQDQIGHSTDLCGSGICQVIDHPVPIETGTFGHRRHGQLFLGRDIRRDGDGQFGWHPAAETVYDLCCSYCQTSSLAMHTTDCWCGVVVGCYL